MAAVNIDLAAMTSHDQEPNLRIVLPVFFVFPSWFLLPTWMMSMIKVYQRLSSLTQLTRELTTYSLCQFDKFISKLNTPHHTGLCAAQATLITHHRLNATEKSLQNSKTLKHYYPSLQASLRPTTVNYCINLFKYKVLGVTEAGGPQMSHAGRLFRAASSLWLLPFKCEQHLSFKLQLFYMQNTIFSELVKLVKILWCILSFNSFMIISMFFFSVQAALLSFTHCHIGPYFYTSVWLNLNNRTCWKHFFFLLS